MVQVWPTIADETVVALLWGAFPKWRKKTNNMSIKKYKKKVVNLLSEVCFSKERFSGVMTLSSFFKFLTSLELQAF